jgi:hypothetical protein
MGANQYIKKTMIVKMGLGEAQAAVGLASFKFGIDHGA